MPLTRESFAAGLLALSEMDDDLARVIDDLGAPPMWARPTGFRTLIRIILEQQVSLASAKAAYDRLVEVAAPLTPGRFLELDDRTLKRAGFSRQKTAYGRYLSKAIIERRLKLKTLGSMDDASVRTELTRIKGIGTWTADIYLLMALRRPDIWPVGDLALALAVKRVKRLRVAPTPERLGRIGAGWRPWRAVAARVLWHHYLSNRKTRS